MEYILNEYNRNVSEKELIADVKRVAELLNKDTIKIEEYDEHGKFNHTTYYRKIGSWKEVLIKAELSIDNHGFNLKDAEIIEDVKKVANNLHKCTLTSREYTENGKYHVTTITRRFSSWEEVLLAAGLQKNGFRRNIAEKELLEEVGRVWELLGRQPTTNDIKEGVSEFSLNTFCRKFGGWRKTLEAFVKYIENEEEDITESKVKIINESGETKMHYADLGITKHKTSRCPNYRLRYKVLLRDKFTCTACGASPAKDTNVILHIDHVVPWEKGGETVFDNLQTLCSICNLGKSNMCNDSLYDE